MEEEIIKVETLPEPCEELKDKVYKSSQSTDDLAKGTYACIELKKNECKPIHDLDDLESLIKGSGETIKIELPLQEEETSEDTEEEKTVPTEELKIYTYNETTFFIRDGKIYVKTDDNFTSEKEADEDFVRCTFRKPVKFMSNRYKWIRYYPGLIKEGE